MSRYNNFSGTAPPPHNWNLPPPRSPAHSPLLIARPNYGLSSQLAYESRQYLYAQDLWFFINPVTLCPEFYPSKQWLPTRSSSRLTRINSCGSKRTTMNFVSPRRRTELIPWSGIPWSACIVLPYLTNPDSTLVTLRIAISGGRNHTRPSGLTRMRRVSWSRSLAPLCPSPLVCTFDSILMLQGWLGV